MKKITAFNLIEIIVALAIISILSIVSINYYRTHVQRNLRQQAIHKLLALHLAEEQYFLQSNHYADLQQLTGESTLVIADGHYHVTIALPNPQTYQINATAQQAQTEDWQAGVSCAELQLTTSALGTSKQPDACWSVK